MVDVLEVEILERSNQALPVSGRVGHFDVEPPLRRQEPRNARQCCRHVTHVFEDMAQNDAVERPGVKRMVIERANHAPMASFTDSSRTCRGWVHP